MVDLMKIADNAAVPLEKHAGAPPLQPAAVEVCDDGDASCVPTTPLEQETQGAAADDAADEESSEIPSTSSSSSSSSDREDMPAAQNDIPGPVWRNRRSHVVHRCSQSTRSTACGRLATSSNFELLEEGCSSLMQGVASASKVKSFRVLAGSSLRWISREPRGPDVDSESALV